MHPKVATRRLSLPLAAGVIAVGILAAIFWAAVRQSPATALGNCTIVWTGSAGDQQWTTPGNWDANRVPEPSDYACVLNSVSQTVILSGGSNIVNGVNVQGSAFSISGGSLELTDSTQPSAVNNLSLSGGTVQVDSAVNLSSSGVWDWTAGQLSGGGTTTIASGATLNLHNSLGGQPQLFLRGGQTLLNLGTANWQAGIFCMDEGAVFNNSGIFNALADGQQTAQCIFGGTVPQFTNAASASVIRSGSGAASISIPFANNGLLKVASGILQLVGDYSQPAGAKFETVIGGTSPGSGFGQLQITGTGTMGANVTVSNASGFTPTPGQSFQIITCGSCMGTFATVTGPYQIVYHPTEVLAVFGQQETIPPTCALTAVIAGPPKQVQIKVQDTGSGLQSITVTTSVNATVDVPPFEAGTTDPVVVTATKIDQTKSSQVGLQATDVAGNVTDCDPMLLTVVAGEPQTIRGVSRSDHILTLYNGSPGLRILSVIVNGKVFVIAQLRSNDVRVLDISSALKAGSRNAITFRGYGRRGSSGDVVLSD